MHASTYFALVFAGLAAVPLTWCVLKTARFIRGSRELKRSMIQAARIKIRWIRVARMLGLYIEDKSPHWPRLSRFLGAFGQKEHRPDALKHPRPIFPRIRVRADQYGVVVRARTVPRIGLAEWQQHTQHLADTWGCTRVAVTQAKPGQLVVRAVRRDPLKVSTTHHPTGLAGTNLSELTIGIDEYAADVPLRLSGVPGIGIYGLPGYGKTSLINKVIADLGPEPCVQFAVLDGKGDGRNVGADYDDLLDRLWFTSGDDLEAANTFLTDLKTLRVRRANSIRKVTGSKNIWTAGEDPITGRRRPGFTPDWPLVIVVIDECQTYFDQVKDGGDKELRRRNSLAMQNASLVEDVVKKGRSVGILVVLATQKGTGDAIPTAIRDVCPVSLSFAQRTTDAAIAALGSDIKDYPEAHPCSLVDPDYIGVASMVVEGRPGFTRVRTPFTPDGAAAAIATANAGLTRDPFTPALTVVDGTNELATEVLDSTHAELPATGTEG